MRSHFALRDLAVLARRLHRSPASVRAQARRLFSRRRKDEPWSEADDARLRASFGVAPEADVALGLGRSVSAVRARARELRSAVVARDWTGADDELLRKVYGSRDGAALELCLGQPLASIEAAAARLCLRKDRRFLAKRAQPSRMPRWTDAGIAELRRLYPLHDNLELARRLGRSVVSVANKANQLGLRKRRQWLAQAGRRHVQRRWQSEAGDSQSSD